MSRPADLLLRLGDTTPAWPTDGQISLYAKTDGIFYKLDANGNETPLIGGSTGAGGTVTSVSATGQGGVLVSGGPITNSGTFTIGLGDITPTSVVSTGIIQGSNLIGVNTGDETINSIKNKLGITTLSGSNTGDQTITLIGDVSGSGTGTFATTLATVNETPGTFGSDTHIPVFRVDEKGRITSVAQYEVAISREKILTTLAYTPYDAANPAGYTANAGTVTSVGVVGSGGIVVTGDTVTDAGVFNLGLGDITPSSIVSAGNITGANLSGVNTGDETTQTLLSKLGINNISGENTGDQTISLVGDVIGSGTGTFETTLATVNTNIGTFGSSTQIPVLTVDAKGRVTGISSVGIGGQLVAGVTTFNSRAGDVSLTHADIVSALGYTPYDAANPADFNNTVGTVTYIEIAGEDGIEVNGSPITSTGTVSLHLTDIKPFSVAASGTITGSNLSGTNTGDQTITLTGDVTGSGTGTFATTLSDTGVVAGAYGTPTKVPHMLVDSKGRIVSITHIDIAGAGQGTGTGTVFSVGLSGGTTGLTSTGGPITNSGVFTLGGVLNIEHGGTGATTADAALNNLLPDQTERAGHLLATDGTNAFWVDSTAWNGTVTEVLGGTSDGVTVTVTDATSTPNISVTLGDIRPTSVYATGNVIGSNLYGTNTGDETSATILAKLGVTTLSGVNTGDETVDSILSKLGITVLTGNNTGDQTITLTGDVTGSGTGTFSATLSDTGVVAGTYGSATTVPQIQVDSKGRITAVTQIDLADFSNSGTVTSVDLSGGTTGLTAVGGPITDSGTLTLGGVLSVAHGGTGASSADGALNNLLPSQTEVPGYILATNGTNVYWTSIPDAAGTVTNVTGVTANGVSVSVANSSTTPNITVTLGDITPLSVTASGSITGSNLTGVNTGDETTATILSKLGVTTLSGSNTGDETTATILDKLGVTTLSGSNTGDETTATILSKLGVTTLSGSNTGDQTITLTGDVTGSGTGTFAATLSETGVVAGSYSYPTLTVDAKGRITSITSGSGAPGTGTVTEVTVASAQGTIAVQGSPIVDSGTINLDLATTGVTAGSYTNADITVDSYGRITDIVSGQSLTDPTYEKVVFKYTSGSGGNLSGADCLISTTPGVSIEVVDGVNCMVRYTFTGRNQLPRSIMMYGQVYDLNEFVVSDCTSMPVSNRRVIGGGTASAPNILTSFSSSNTILLQHRMSDSYSSASLGQRAHLILMFGF